MKAIIIALAAALSLGASAPKQEQQQQQQQKIRIVAHRGYWNCEQAGYTQNCIASLKAAQDAGLWGSEFDVWLTADDQIIVNHDAHINKVKIKTNNLDTLKAQTLKNGEHPSTLDEYLTQGEKCSTTMLVLEFKDQNNPERNLKLVDLTIDKLKAHGLYSPDRVMFISFSRQVCDYVAQIAPEFHNQYLSGDATPEDLSKTGVNGIDYQKNIINQQTIDEAHAKGMSTNSWTVNDIERMKELIGSGCQAITTNEPMLLRSVLGDRELKIEQK